MQLGGRKERKRGRCEGYKEVSSGLEKRRRKRQIELGQARYRTRSDGSAKLNLQQQTPFLMIRSAMPCSQRSGTAFVSQ
jgi:hypothetical protein